MSLLVGHPNILGLHAALAAYRDGQPWLDALLVYLEDNRDFLVDYVNGELQGISIWKPEGTYLWWRKDTGDYDVLPATCSSIYLPKNSSSNRPKWA